MGTPQRIGTFVVSDRIWQNQSKFLRTQFWTRILQVRWDDTQYWITVEAPMFDLIQPGDVIPDYSLTLRRHSVTAKRVAIAG
jgi:hypothetical protein